MNQVVLVETRDGEMAAVKIPAGTDESAFRDYLELELGAVTRGCAPLLSLAALRKAI